MAHLLLVKWCSGSLWETDTQTQTHTISPVMSNSCQNEEEEEEEVNLNTIDEVDKGEAAMKETHEHIFEKYIFVLFFGSCQSASGARWLCEVASASTVVQVNATAGWLVQPFSTCTFSPGLQTDQCWTAMTSDINYNQEEESATRNLQIWNIHTRQQFNH